jgi:hypothetical protein
VGVFCDSAQIFLTASNKRRTISCCYQLDHIC